MATFQLFLQSWEQVIVRWGQIWRIGWVIKTLKAQVGQFLLGCKCPVSHGIVVQEQDPLGDLPAAFFFQNVLQLLQQRWVILRVYSLALGKIINEEDAVFILKNFEARTFPADFCTRNNLGRGEPLCRHSIDCCFVSGSQWYNQVSSMVTNRARQEIIWIAPNEKIQKVAQATCTVDVFDPRSGTSGTLCGELPHVQIFMNDGPNPVTWDAQLISYWFSRNPSGGLPRLPPEFDQ